MTKSMRANLLLLTTALIWGLAFVAQDVAGDVLEPFTFCSLRMSLSALALVPVVFWMGRKKEASAAGPAWKQMTGEQKKTLVWGGVCCGVMLALGSGFQQLGISLGTGVGKAGFISALYIVMVPLLGIFWRRRIGVLVWIAVVLSAVGLYLLCMQGSFSALEPGDVAIMFSALCYSGHILVVDHFSPKTDGVRMSCIQFAVTAVICLICSAILENPTWEAVRACTIPILYAGVLSGAVGYTFQILAQKDAEPTVASLLMSLESVFAVLAGWVILGDKLSLRELAGCALMMAGIVLAQLPQKKNA